MPEGKPEEVRRLEEAIAAIEAMDDDEAAAKAASLVLDSWPEHGKRLAAIRQQRVNKLRNERRLTWAAIGALLVRKDGKGVSAARAQQIAKGISGYKLQRAKEEAERPAKGQADE